MRKQIAQTPHTSLNLLLKVNELEVEHEIAFFRNGSGDPGLLQRQMDRRHVLGVEEADLRGDASGFCRDTSIIGNEKIRCRCTCTYDVEAIGGTDECGRALMRHLVRASQNFSQRESALQCGQSCTIWMDQRR